MSLLMRHLCVCVLLTLFNSCHSIVSHPIPSMRRIFQVGLRPFSDGREGGFGQTGMSFPDFIFFMLAEEDKSSDAALRYW